MEEKKHLSAHTSYSERAITVTIIRLFIINDSIMHGKPIALILIII